MSKKIWHFLIEYYSDAAGTYYYIEAETAEECQKEINKLLDSGTKHEDIRLYERKEITFSIDIKL